MKISTKITSTEKIASLFGINRKFLRYEKDYIDKDKSIFISPAQAEVIFVGKIKEDGKLVSKFGKNIDLHEALGENAKLFSEGFYITLYLSPKDKHYWRIPYDCDMISTKINNGKAKIPIIVGLEKFFPKVDFLEKAIEKNASIGSVFRAKYFEYGLIALGSFNVNSIKIINKKFFKKGDFAGHFNLGSCIILCFPKKSLKILANPKTKLQIGDRLIKIDIPSKD